MAGRPSVRQRGDDRVAIDILADRVGCRKVSGFAGSSPSHGSASADRVARERGETLANSTSTPANCAPWTALAICASSAAVASFRSVVAGIVPATNGTG